VQKNRQQYLFTPWHLSKAAYLAPWGHPPHRHQSPLGRFLPGQKEDVSSVNLVTTSSRSDSCELPPIMMILDTYIFCYQVNVYQKKKSFWWAPSNALHWQLQTSMHQKVYVSYAESQDSRLSIKIKKTVNRGDCSVRVGRSSHKLITWKVCSIKSSRLAQYTDFIFKW